MSALLSVQNVSKSFSTPRGTVHAVSDVSFDLAESQTLALVGESGCGKSTVASAVMRLADIQQGRILFRNDDIFAMGSGELQDYRRKVSIVFQNPY